MASLPVPAVQHDHADGARRTLLRAKMLRTSSSTTRTFLPTRASSEPCKLIEHSLSFDGQVGDDAMQEEGGFVEQALGDSTPLTTTLRARVCETGVFLRRRAPCR